MGVLTGKKNKHQTTEATRRQESVRKPLGQHPSADGEYHQLAPALREGGSMAKAPQRQTSCIQL